MWLLALAVALAAAGFAVADTGSPKAIKSVSASFSATGVSNSRTQTCTNQDGTFSFTRADYAGTATSSDPSLNGPVKLHVRSSINTTKNVGVVDGTLRITTASGKNTDAHFDAVYQNGQLSGLASGHAQEPYARLLANLSAGFSATGGFTNGHLGNSSGGGAVEVQPGGCEPSHAQGEEQSEAHGTISALSQTSITVSGLTCSIPANLAAQIASQFKLGDRVAIRCTLINGQNTLVKIKPAKGED